MLHLYRPTVFLKKAGALAAILGTLLLLFISIGAGLLGIEDTPIIAILAPLIMLCYTFGAILLLVAVFQRH